MKAFAVSYGGCGKYLHIRGAIGVHIRGSCAIRHSQKPPGGAAFHVRSNWM
jgi:hypothetical protein